MSAAMTATEKAIAERDRLAQRYRAATKAALEDRDFRSSANQDRLDSLQRRRRTGHRLR